jgi:hypothetical protein
VWIADVPDQGTSYLTRKPVAPVGRPLLTTCLRAW